MILGLDTGMATCGWALLDDSKTSFVDLGVVITKVLNPKDLTLERARRMNTQANVVAEKAAGCHTVVVEQMSFPPGANAKIAIALSWGVVLGIVTMLDPRPRLITIAPQKWQRTVLPNAGKKVDYDELSRVAAKFILSKHPRAAVALQSIPKSHRSHAIDAAMLALVGALRPRDCDAVAA